MARIAQALLLSCVLCATFATCSDALLARKWKPEPDSGKALYEGPTGTMDPNYVAPCPVETFTSPDGCQALFSNKTDAEKCPSIQQDCPYAEGVKFKLVCGGGCCPQCWVPDHVLAMDRHTTIKSPYVVSAAPQAPTTCGGVKCFKPVCAAGLSPGHVQGDCCYSCTPTR